MSDTDTTTQDQGGNNSTLVEIENVVSTVGTVVTALVPGGEIAGVGVSTITGIIKGILSAEPTVVAAYNDVKAAIDGGAAPTDDQLDALMTSVDAVDDQVQQDAQAT